MERDGTRWERAPEYVLYETRTETEITAVKRAPRVYGPVCDRSW